MTLIRHKARIVLSLFTLFVGGFSIAHLRGAEQTDSRPNFLFIIADDCTFRDIGCYGGQAITPNIDSLAQQGMRFTQCFQQAPMCSPTRHAIYTGIYPVKSGAYPNHTFVKDGTKSIAHYLEPLGYRVHLSGKTHINPKSSFPFEYSGKKNPDFKAIDQLLTESTRDGTPFCLFACSNEPHGPWNKGDASQYDSSTITLPPYFVDTRETRENMVDYLAEITYFDGQVGALLALLDKHGIAENTMVVVVSEQGSSFPFGKWTCYDTGLQSACIVRWPGQVKVGSVTDAMVEYVDIVPTFIDAAGGSREAAIDGMSFVPVLTGETNGHKRFVFGEMTTRGINKGSLYFGIRSIRSEKYKYIVNFTPDVTFQNACTNSTIFKSWRQKASDGDATAAEKINRYENRPAEEFYAIQEDPYEWHNLANDPRYAMQKAELKQELSRWMEECGDQGQQTELEALEHQGRSRQSKDTRRIENTGKL
jgi:uncharacterized sulfatase